MPFCASGFMNIFLSRVMLKIILDPHCGMVFTSKQQLEVIVILCYDAVLVNKTRCLSTIRANGTLTGVVGKRLLNYNYYLIINYFESKIS